jgi:hypothetical protein
MMKIVIRRGSFSPFASPSRERIKVRIYLWIRVIFQVLCHLALRLLTILKIGCHAGVPVLLYITGTKHLAVGYLDIGSI